MSNEQILERKRFAARYKVYFLSIMLRFTDSDCKTFSREEKNKKNMAEEMYKEKFKKLISEYKKFKMKNVKHSRFHPNASHFGKSSWGSFCEE